MSKLPPRAYYTWLWADTTKHRWATSPTQDTSIPIYLSSSPTCPEAGGTFEHGRAGGRSITYRTRHVLEVGHGLNPFMVPLVVAVRANVKE
jgi:hypothetical protein